MPEAVTQLTTPVTALCYNLMLAGLIGDVGVSTFGILSFIYSLANAILSGVAQGLQPLWGQCYGKKDTEEMNWYFRSGIIINTILSFVPMAYNLIYTAFLFSTKRTGASNVIAISRGIVLKALAIFLIPLIAGTNAIWIAPPLCC